MIAASQIKGEPADDRFERQPPLEQRGATAHRTQSDGDKRHGDPNYLLSSESSEEEEEEGGGCVGSGRSVRRPAGSFRTDQSTTRHASSRQKMGGVPDSKASIKPAAGKQKIYILYYSSIIWIRLLWLHII